jgi:alpha-glucosidase (family GH31 glycosyl hydrolase)
VLFRSPGAYAFDTEYLWGPSILVAPVLNAEGRSTVYLPRGVWYDLFTGERAEGPAALRRTVPLDEVPMFVRSGGIVASTAAETVVRDFWRDLEVDVYGRADGSVEIPEEGGKASTTVKIAAAGRKVAAEIGGPKRNWVLRFRDVGEPRNYSTAAAATISYDAKLRIATVRAENVEGFAFSFEAD